MCTPFIPDSNVPEFSQLYESCLSKAWLFFFITAPPLYGAWFAVRAYGKSTAKAHSGIVYMTVEGSDGFWSVEKAPAIVDKAIKIINTAMEKPDINDPRIWATGGRIKQMWEEALPSNRKRARQAQLTLKSRLKKIAETGALNRY